MGNADWVKVPVVETVQRVVCATTNRVFVGTPLCARKLSDPSLNSNRYLVGRDQDYLTLNLNFAANVIKFATIIGMFPKPLKSYVAMSSDRHESVSLS